MIIKRYIVNNMSEAMTKIKKELGEEAIIISQRKVRRKGIAGYFSPKVIEVTATVERINDAPVDAKRIDVPKADAENIENLKKLIGKQRARVDFEAQKETTYYNDMQNIKEMMADLKNDVGVIAAKGKRKSKLETELIENDVNENIVGNILKKIKDIDKKINAREKAKMAIKDMVSISQRKNEKIIVLVGPTGVGKTTTIAKLAGKYALIDKKKVGIITIDTYRIGAVEQIKTYADIMNLPLKVVFSINDMEAAVKSMQSCDVILVDTTGRSSKNAMQIIELRAFIDKLKIGSVNLVISCTTKNHDIETIIKGYSILNFNNVIITKLDETSTYGSILNIIERAGKPLSFVTTGQNVPNDIKFVDGEKLANLILGGENI
jgi:flagellar biosynthesis protein FlhF